MNTERPCHQFTSRVGRALRRVCLYTAALLLSFLSWMEVSPADEVHLFRSLRADRTRVYQGPPGSGGGHPLVCRLGNGEVLAVFQAWQADSDWRILSARSGDGGLHWTEPRVLVDSDGQRRKPRLGCAQRRQRPVRLRDFPYLSRQECPTCPLSCLPGHALHRPRQELEFSGKDPGRPRSGPGLLFLHHPTSRRHRSDASLRLRRGRGRRGRPGCPHPGTSAMCTAPATAVEAGETAA